MFPLLFILIILKFFYLARPNTTIAINVDKQSLHTECLICASRLIEPLEHFQNVGMCKCEDCGFTFSQWVPSKEELKDYYSNAYDRTNYFSPITEKRYNQLLDKFEQYKSTNRILDVGAGCGFFLKTAKKRGWEVYGTEITESATSNCKDNDIQLSFGELHELNFPENYFDVVVHIEVIEHLNNPNDFIREIQRILRPGGITYLSTPNFNAIHRYRLKGQYDVIGYPNHLCYYTPKTLKKLFKAHDLAPIRIKTTGYSLTRLRTSKGKSNQSFVSETSDDEMMRYKIESNIFLKVVKTTLNGLLNLFKIGDSLKGTFIKK